MSGNLVSVFREARGHGVSVRPRPDPMYTTELTVNLMSRVNASLVPRPVGGGSENDESDVHIHVHTCSTSLVPRLYCPAFIHTQ